MTISVTDASDPSKELLWLASVFSGIVFCKIVYTLTGIVSLPSFKAYGKLSDFGKVEWNNRGFSTFHALVAASFSLYLVLFSSTFCPGSSNELLISRTSSLSDMTLGVKTVYPLGFYSLLTVPPILAMMNVFWFWKIARGMIKTLKKARHSK